MLLKNDTPVEYTPINVRCRTIITYKYLRDHKMVTNKRVELIRYSKKTISTFYHKLLNVKI